MEFGEGSLDEARAAGEVAGETDGAHAAGIGFEVETRGKVVDWFFR